MANLEEQYDAALDLSRRVSPKNVTENSNSSCQQNQDLAEELLSTVDQPLASRTDSSGKQFSCCDYNRDGDSYRSPFTNKFVPPLDDADELAPALRKLEVTANDAFDTYRELYYEGGHSSCYLWDQDSDIAGVVLFQKKSPKSRWDSVHVFEVLKGSNKSKATYQSTSTVMLEIGRVTNSSGNSTRQSKREMPVEQEVDHVSNVGMLVEEMENKSRGSSHEVYFGKTRDIVGDIRSIESLDELEEERRSKQAVVDSL